MVQLITFLLVVAALVTLVLQNLSPVIGLVVLGRATLELPLAVWLLIAIAIGALCTLIIYQLVPGKRTYRPMGKRLSDPPPPEPTTRFMDTPSEPAPNRVQSETNAPEPSPNTSQNPYDNDWNDFKAPEQWEDWGQQTATADYESRDRRPSAPTDEAMRDIESGWGEDDYEASGRYASRRDPGPDMGWDNRQGYPADTERPSTRTYDEGWLYGNDSGAEQPVEGRPEPGEPQPEDPDEDVYDANYRVIIPPYDPKDS